MINLENRIERDELIDDYFNKGLECNIKEVYQAVVNTVADLEYANDEKIKEIERLNNIIEEYKNANEYHQKIIHELETMKQPNQLHSENVKLRAENNRLNNIINEIYTKANDTNITSLDLREYILNNLGDDKE